MSSAADSGRWVELTVRVNRSWAEAVEAVAGESGWLGAAVHYGAVASADPWAEPPVGPEPELCEVRAYRSEGEPIETALHHVRQRLAVLRAAGMPAAEVSHRVVSDGEWRDGWRAYYRPFRAGVRLVICPSWEDYTAAPGDLVLRLDPGMAFGTGTHPTTRLCLEALEERVRPGDRILDWGTGSGILAIAAGLLGAGEILAIDQDPAAVDSARDNLLRNGLADRVELRQGGIESCPARAAFDLIVANITADPILSGLEAALARLRPGGTLLLCGISEHRAQEVRAALQTGEPASLEERSDEGWRLFAARLR